MDIHNRVAHFRPPLIVAAILLAICSSAHAAEPVSTPPTANVDSRTAQPDARFRDVAAINKQLQQNSQTRASSSDGAAALARAWTEPVASQPESQALLERYPILGALAAIAVLSVLGAIIRSMSESRKARAQRKAATADLLKGPPRL